MPYHSRPISDAEIEALPLRFVRLEQGEEDAFTDVLLQIWFALAQSGSLATLPPVPDIVGFVDNCAIFYLIFHTNPSELNLGSGDFLTSVPVSPPPKAASPSKASPRSSPNKRPHPYANARPKASHSTSIEDRSDASSSRLSSSPTPDDPPRRSDEVIGCVYLSYSQSTQNTVDIGIALRPEARGRGFGRATITKFLRMSFETLRVHRVVANVFGPSDLNQQESARESGTVRWIFEKLGFVPEGVQRRAAFSAAEGIWRDVYPLAMLDMDWVRLGIRTPGGRESITSPFDAMLERHNTEREEMSEWMDDPSWGRLRRVSSAETVKGCDEPTTSTQEPESEPEPEPERSPSPIRSESSYAVPSEHDWRSPTPGTDAEYSVVSHSPPPYSIIASPAPDSDAFSNVSLSDFSSPRFDPTTPNPEPTPFSMIGSPDLEPPLSPGFSNTDDEVIELSSLPSLARELADATDAPISPPPTESNPLLESPPEPHTVGPIPIPRRRNVFAFQDDDEPIDLWANDSDFDRSERGR